MQPSMSRLSQSQDILAYHYLIYWYTDTGTKHIAFFQALVITKTGAILPCVASRHGSALLSLPTLCCFAAAALNMLSMVGCWVCWRGGGVLSSCSRRWALGPPPSFPTDGTTSTGLRRDADMQLRSMATTTRRDEISRIYESHNDQPLQQLRPLTSARRQSQLAH